MCLLVKKTDGCEVNIAEADITTYKVLIKDHKGNLSTPYRNSWVQEDVNYKSDLIFEEYPNMLSAYNHVGIGLHSLKSISDAKRLKSKMYSKNESIVIYKCVIPKGSKYYKGIFKDYGWIFPSYASDALTYIKEISIYDETTDGN